MASVWVYALHFECGAIYVGITNDASRRLEEHERRQSPSTCRISGAITVIYREEFPDYGQARRQEKYLKSGAGRKLLLERQGVGRPKGA